MKLRSHRFPMQKPCKLCQKEEAIKGERYCNDCKKTKLKEMKESGYFGPIGGLPFGNFRGIDEREAIHETKRGLDQ